MTISTVNGLLAAMANPAKRAQFAINKASIATQGAAGWSSLWRATGTPTQGAIPGAAAVIDDTLAGALVNFADASGGEGWVLAKLDLARGNAGDQTILYDRLAHMGGLSGATTGNQTVNVDVSGATNNLANRINQTTYEDVEWFAEIYTDIGTTGQTCTVTYTPAGGGSNTLTFTLGGASPLNQDSRLFPLITTNGEFIKSIQTVSIGTTTGTAGSWGITAAKRLVVASAAVVANRMDSYAWDQLGLPPIANQACLWLAQLCITTSTGIAVGGGLMVAG